MGNELSKIDYLHWCKQVGSEYIKVYKDTVCVGAREILKSDLEPSPVQIQII